MEPCVSCFYLACCMERVKISIMNRYKLFQRATQRTRVILNDNIQTGLSKVAGCRQKSPPTWLESAGYSAWHFFMDGIF